jgi:hypothetical protein
MIEVENQGVGFQVVRTILLTKKESDKIAKQLKLQGKKLYKRHVDIKLTKKELMLD